MDEHRRHAERVGDQAGVLPAGAAEAVERVVAHIDALGDRDALDRVRHVLHRDADEAVGDLFRRAPVFAANSPNAVRTRASSNGVSPRAPKIFGKYAPFSLPTMTFASVTVSGPPAP